MHNNKKIQSIISKVLIGLRRQVLEINTEAKGKYRGKKRSFICLLFIYSLLLETENTTHTLVVKVVTMISPLKIRYK